MSARRLPIDAPQSLRYNCRSGKRHNRLQESGLYRRGKPPGIQSEEHEREKEDRAEREDVARGILRPGDGEEEGTQSRVRDALEDTDRTRLHARASSTKDRYLDDLGFPGDFPYTRGVYPTMYRGRPWTIRQYAGFGTARETNQRFHFLLEKGQKGLSVAFDLPTQMGYDSDDAMAQGEVGRVGVAIDSIDDMRVLFDGIPLGEISTSMTINATAAILLALYVALADERGIDRAKLSRHDPERHPQGVHRARDVRLSSGALDAAHHRHSRVVRGEPPQLEPDQHQRVPHPRGGVHRGPGSRLHARRRRRLRGRRRQRRVSTSTRSRRGFPSSSTRTTTSRGGRQVPGGAQDVGAHHEGSLRREESGEPAASFPHADGGVHAHRPAAGEQRRAGDDPGARRRSRRDAVAPHQQPRRGTGSSERQRGSDRASHPADHPGGIGSLGHHRSARRELRRRIAHERDRNARRRAHGDESKRRAGWSRRSNRDFPSARSRRRAGSIRKRSSAAIRRWSA